jgi:hypothetical protein
LRCHFAAALSTACDAGERPLTLSVVPRARPGRDQTPPGAPRTDFPASSSKGAASSAQSAFHRQVLPRVRFRGARFVGARHQCLGFATEDPASDAPSLPRCSRPEWLDPASRSSALHRGGVTGQTSPVDFCNQFSIREHDRQTVRTPRTALMVAHESSCFSNRSLSAAGRIAGGCARAHANQDVTGQGPTRRRLPSCAAPPAAIARGGSFTPTRSARTPHVARS